MAAGCRHVCILLSLFFLGFNAACNAQTLVQPSTTASLRTALIQHCRPHTRRVTFSLPDTEWAGGFGDRLLGLVTTYYVATMTASGLDVNWTRPYDLRDYFSVVDCAHIAAAAQTRRHKQSGRLPRPSTPVSIRLPPQAATTRTIPAVDRWQYFQGGAFLADAHRNVNVMTNGRHWHDVVATPAVAAKTAALALTHLDRQQLFKLAVDALLVPRRNVVRAARAVLADLAGDGGTGKMSFNAPSSLPFYVGVQIRCGSHGSLSWYDPTRHSLADMPCFVAETVAACGGRTPCPVFLTADSRTAADAFRDELAKQRGARTIVVTEAQGPILHTDRTNATAAAATGAADPWLRSIVDWWMLKHAAALVISRSGFGETAAWASAGNVPTRRIELGQVASRRVCNVTDFDAASVF